MSEVDSSIPENYSVFLKDLSEVNTEILPEEILRQKIVETRDESLTEEQKLTARNDIIQSNLRLIPYIVKQLPKTGISPEELVGESFEVLDTCINNFDLNNVSSYTEEHPKFSSYFIASLSARLRSPISIVRTNEVMSVPAYVSIIQGLMSKARELFMQEEEKEPTHEEWYKRTVKLAGEEKSLNTLKSVTPETFDSTQAAKFQSKMRLGKEMGRGKVDTDTLSVRYGNIEDTIIDESVDVENEVIKSLMKEDIYKSLKGLASNERSVIELRFGLGLNEDGKPKDAMTLGQIAKILGVKTERIRQIELRALKKLRRFSRTNAIGEYVGIPYEDKSDTHVDRVYKSNLTKENGNRASKY